jgi:hypothetical protein
MRRFASSSWDAMCHVDGRALGGSVWRPPFRPMIQQYLHRIDEQGQLLEGDLTFALAVSLQNAIVY